MYHYDMNTASLSQQQDQKPVFNVIPPIPVGSENWNRCQGSGEDSLTSLGALNFPGRSVFSNGYSSPGMRPDVALLHPARQQPRDHLPSSAWCAPMKLQDVITGC